MYRSSVPLVVRHKRRDPNGHQELSQIAEIGEAQRIGVIGRGHVAKAGRLKVPPVLDPRNLRFPLALKPRLEFELREVAQPPLELPPLRV